MKSTYTLLITFLIISANCFSADKSINTKEINHLLEFIKDSECVFTRNGKSYPSSEAYEHINRKYQYVLDKGLIKTTEDFIKYSATKSSMSGKRYSVSCSGNQALSEDWLKEELTRFRDK